MLIPFAIPRDTHCSTPTNPACSSQCNMFMLTASRSFLCWRVLGYSAFECRLQPPACASNLREAVPCAAQIRERDWCNVVTAHAGDPAAYAWRLAHLALGDAVLGPPAGPRARGRDPHPPAPATAVALSSCGNFALVGSAAGRVDRYNMQSGLHRGYYARCALSYISKPLG